MVSPGSSSTDATRYLAKTLPQLSLDQAACMLEWDAVQHVAEKSLHEHALCGLLRNSARAQVEHVLRVDGSDCRAVRAADVVVVDLEHRDRGRLGVVGQDQ